MPGLFDFRARAGRSLPSSGRWDLGPRLLPLPLPGPQGSPPRQHQHRTLPGPGQQVLSRLHSRGLQLQGLRRGMQASSSRRTPRTCRLLALLPRHQRRRRRQNRTRTALH